MNYVYVFLVGVLVGAVVMVFVYRNNVGKLTKIADEAEEKYEKLEKAVREKAKKG